MKFNLKLRRVKQPQILFTLTTLIRLRVKRIKKRLNKAIKPIRAYLKKERLIAISLLSRILGLIVVLSVAPISTVQVKADQNKPEKQIESNIQLDVQRTMPVYIPERDKAEITLGESNYQREQREAEEAKKQEEAQKLALEVQRTRQVISREQVRSSNADVSFSEKRKLVQEAATQYGIDWKILEAVWEVESGKSWDTNKRSYAGATGPMQFMPSTFRNHAVDGDGDGMSDITSAKDTVYSGAKFLADCGAASGNIDQALLAYNHAQWYVNKVKRVAESIKE